MLLSYKKFIFYIIALLFILWGIYSYMVLNKKILYMDREYPMWSEVLKTIVSKNHNYNLVIIGDSRAKAGVIPDILDSKIINSYNLSLGGATPIEGYFTLKKYLLNNIAPKYLLLSYAPFHLRKQYTYWGRTIKFGFLNYWENKEVYEIATKLNDSNQLGKNNYLESKIFTGKYLIALKNGILEHRWESNQQTLKFVQKSKGQYFFGRNSKASGYNPETLQNHFKSSPLLNYYLEKLIELADSKNIKIFWYTMPFNESSFKKIDHNYISEYNAYIQELSLKYNFIILRDLYYLNNINFGDPSHLFNGAKKTTLDIKTRLENSNSNL